MVVAEKLAEFAINKGVTIDVTQAQAMKAGNVDKAEQYLEIAQMQEGIIATLLESNIPITPLIPDIGVPDTIRNDLTVVLDTVITGSEPITVDVIKEQNDGKSKRTNGKSNGSETSRQASQRYGCQTQRLR